MTKREDTGRIRPAGTTAYRTSAHDKVLHSLMESIGLDSAHSVHVLVPPSAEREQVSLIDINPEAYVQQGAETSLPLQSRVSLQSMTRIMGEDFARSHREVEMNPEVAARILCELLEPLTRKGNSKHPRIRRLAFCDGHRRVVAKWGDPEMAGEALERFLKEKAGLLQEVEKAAVVASLIQEALPTVASIDALESEMAVPEAKAAVDTLAQPPRIVLYRFAHPDSCEALRTMLSEAGAQVELREGGEEIELAFPAPDEPLAFMTRFKEIMQARHAARETISFSGPVAFPEAAAPKEKKPAETPSEVTEPEKISFMRNLMHALGAWHT